MLRENYKDASYIELLIKHYIFAAKTFLLTDKMRQNYEIDVVTAFDAQYKTLVMVVADLLGTTHAKIDDFIKHTSKDTIKSKKYNLSELA